MPCLREIFRPGRMAVPTEDDMPLTLTKPDGSVPHEQAEAQTLADAELLALDQYLSSMGAAPMANFERSMVKTYIMAKLSGKVANEVGE